MGSSGVPFLAPHRAVTCSSFEKLGCEFLHGKVGECATGLCLPLLFRGWIGGGIGGRRAGGRRIWRYFLVRIEYSSGDGSGVGRQVSSVAIHLFCCVQVYYTVDRY